MVMEGLGTAEVTDNGYQYNGKEWNEDLGLNWSDYGARWYDAALGRWWAIDPLGEDQANYSTYTYVYNNPVFYHDPTGMSAADDFYYSADGLTTEQWLASSNPANKGKTADQYRKENRQKDGSTMPTLWIANESGVSTTKLVSSLNVASDIFAKNGYTGITYKFISPDEARKHEYAYPYQAFLAIRNDELPSEIGNSNRDDPDGRIGVFRTSAGHPHASWKSYVNFGRQEISQHTNPTYAAGYIIAHEYLHQILTFASYYREGDRAKFGHNNSELNLNMWGDHSSFIMPTGPSKTLQTAERILQPEKEYLDYFFQIKR